MFYFSLSVPISFLRFEVILNIPDATMYDSIRKQVLAYQLDDYTPSEVPKLDLFSFPCLRRFTVRLDVVRTSDGRKTCSCLPAAVRICKTASRMQHVAISICIDSYLLSLSDIDFSPLVDLGKLSTSFDHHVDIYVYSTKECLFRIDVDFALAQYEGVLELIEQGLWVLHVNEVAPTDPRFIACPLTLCFPKVSNDSTGF